MTDRNGKNLTSGGDVQIILNAVRMGYYAGSSHLLKLNHIIKKERLKLRKITKLQYWLSSSYKKAYNEIFPDNAFEISYISNKQIFSLIYYHIKVVLFKYGYKEAVFRFYARLGELNSNVIASNQTRSPALLKFFENLIR